MAAPQRTALVDGTSGRTASWADIRTTAAAWASAHGRLTGPHHGRVGLAIADPVDMAASFLAALAAGITVVPLDANAPASQLAADVRTFGVSSLVLDSVSLDDQVSAVAQAGVDVWSLKLERLSARIGASHAERAHADAAVIMASSGTTGPRKLIPLTEGQLVHAAFGVAHHHHLTPDDRGYSPLPLFHINGLVVGVLSTLVSGGSLVVDRRFSRSRCWTTVEAHGATWVNLVPAIIALLADPDTPAPSAVVTRRVRFARSASAPLAPATLARFEARTGISVLETYGMTEAASQITANPLDPVRRRPGSVGLPVGIELRVVDHAGRPLAAGLVGNVEIRGRSVAGAGWLTTGDLGRLDDDGYLWLVGRDGDVINRGGEKIFPADVEHVLLCDHRVTAAIVVGRPDDVVGEEPVAFVIAKVAADQRDQLAAELAARCRSELSRFKQPVRITVAESLPAGPTGKVRRSALRQLAARGAQEAQR